MHHLLHKLGDPKNSVIFVGYQAYGSRGRALLEGADSVGIFGHRVQVRAQIHSLQGLSAHADRRDLLRWVQSFPGPPKRIFLNHGEDPARKALAAELAEAGLPRPVLPTSGESVPW